MLRRLTVRQRRAITRWIVLLISALLLFGAFTAVPYIASALPAFSPRAEKLISGGEPEAVPTFALSGGGSYPRTVADEPLESSEPTYEPIETSDEEETEEPIPAPTPGEGDLPVFAKNLCWYDDPAEAELNIINRTKYKINLASYASAKFPFRGDIGDEPLVLIMHTHGSESYLENGYDFYNSGEKFRSPGDDSKTVVHIGDVLAERLNELGIPALHDRKMYDTAVFNKSYTYSREGILKALKEYPSIKFVIDLHRDSIFNSNGQNVKPLTEINGSKSAQIMIVVGTDEGGATHPNWKRNLTVAAHLQQTLNDFFPTLARPVNIRTSAFNQSLTDGSILIECGSCGNTVEEAETAILFFAEAYAYMLKEEFEG